MNREMLEALKIQYHTHWWFQARHNILSKVVDMLMAGRPREKVNILELGCGSGMMLSVLQKYGTVDAVEISEVVLDYAKEHNSSVNIKTSLLPSIDFEDNKYDMICAFDVIEHIEQDAQTIENIHTKLKAGGVCFITVPAYPFLYSVHDVENHHVRRYTLASLQALFCKDIFSISYCSYFNCYLFPIAACVRIIKNILKISKHNESKTPHPLVNKLFFFLFNAEQKKIYKGTFPFGLSLMIVVQRK